MFVINIQMPCSVFRVKMIKQPESNTRPLNESFCFFPSFLFEANQSKKISARLIVPIHLLPLPTALISHCVSDSSTARLDDKPRDLIPFTASDITVRKHSRRPGDRFLMNN